MPWKWTSSAQLSSDKRTHSHLQVLTSVSTDKHRKVSTAFCALLDATQSQQECRCIKDLQVHAMIFGYIPSKTSRLQIWTPPFSPGFIPFVLFCCQSVIPLSPPVTATILEVEVRLMCSPPPTWRVEVLCSVPAFRSRPSPADSPERATRHRAPLFPTDCKEKKSRRR